MSVQVQFDTAAVAQKIENRLNKVQAMLDMQVLKDSNYFCPMDTGMLKNSGILATVPGSGKVIWNTPYAHKQYYECPNKSHQENPNACMKWFEAAKAKWSKAWERLINGEYKKAGR